MSVATQFTQTPRSTMDDSDSHFNEVKRLAVNAVSDLYSCVAMDDPRANKILKAWNALREI